MGLPGQGLGQQVNAGGYSRPAVNYDFCGIFHRRPVLDQFCGGAHSAPVVGYGLPEVVHRAGNAARDRVDGFYFAPKALWRAGIDQHNVCLVFALRAPLRGSRPKLL